MHWTRFAHLIVGIARWKIHSLGNRRIAIGRSHLRAKTERIIMLIKPVTTQQKSCHGFNQKHLVWCTKTLKRHKKLSCHKTPRPTQSLLPTKRNKKYPWHRDVTTSVLCMLCQKVSFRRFQVSSSRVTYLKEASSRAEVWHLWDTTSERDWNSMY